MTLIERRTITGQTLQFQSDGRIARTEPCQPREEKFGRKAFPGQLPTQPWQNPWWDYLDLTAVKEQPIQSPPGNHAMTATIGKP